MFTMKVPVGRDVVNWVLNWPDAVVKESAKLIDEMKRLSRTLQRHYGT